MRFRTEFPQKKMAKHLLNRGGGFFIVVGDRAGRLSVSDGISWERVERARPVTTHSANRPNLRSFLAGARFLISSHPSRMNLSNFARAAGFGSSERL